jgi:hypothetical protein
MTREECIRNAGRVLAEAALRIAREDAEAVPEAS